MDDVRSISVNPCEKSFITQEAGATHTYRSSLENKTDNVVICFCICLYLFVALSTTCRREISIKGHPKQKHRTLEVTRTEWHSVLQGYTSDIWSSRLVSRVSCFNRLSSTTNMPRKHVFFQDSSVMIGFSSPVWKGEIANWLAGCLFSGTEWYEAICWPWLGTKMKLPCLGSIFSLNIWDLNKAFLRDKW